MVLSMGIDTCPLQTASLRRERRTLPPGHQLAPRPLLLILAPHSTQGRVRHLHGVLLAQPLRRQELGVVQLRRSLLRIYGGYVAGGVVDEVFRARGGGAGVDMFLSVLRLGGRGEFFAHHCGGGVGEEGWCGRRGGVGTAAVEA